MVELPRPEGPAASADGPFVARRRDPAPPPPPRPAVPGWAAMLIGGLLLGGIAAASALAAVALDGDTPDAAPAVPVAAAPASPVDDRTFAADPSPIPAEMLTALEAVGEGPIDVELGRLLEAIGHGFGTRSARLDPTLQSYVYRMGSRFEWSADSFRVAVTAPDSALAVARADLLSRLFSGAVATGQLRLGTGTGPHKLALVSPTTD